jgi:hypothetical protein
MERSMYKIFSFLIVIGLLSISLGCATQKFSESVELNLKSKDYESSRARFKFYDASEGCPSYNDLPGAAAYIGKAKVSSSATTMLLPTNKKIHVFYFKPSDMPVLTAKGGAKEIRRRSIQIVLADGKPELQLIKDENDKMKWIAEGSIKLEPATNCAQIKDGITNP